MVLNNDLLEHTNTTLKEQCEKGKAYHKKMIESGMVYTSLGWLKKEWLSRGYEMNALSTPVVEEVAWYEMPMKYYHLIVKPEYKTKIIREGTGRVKKEVQSEHIDVTQWLYFLEYLKIQRELQKQNEIVK